MGDTWANELARDMEETAALELMFKGSPGFNESSVVTVMIVPGSWRSTQDDDGFDEPEDHSSYEDPSDEDDQEYFLDDHEKLKLSNCSTVYDVSHEETVGSRTEVKNERERTRVKRKADLLEQLKELIKQSCLTDVEAKRRRFTEVTQEVISSYRVELERLRHQSKVQLPFIDLE